MFIKKCGNAEDLAETAKKRKKLAPKPLPATRPRALTPPLAEITPQKRVWWNPLKPKKRVRQRTSDQPGSMLVTKLPPEIRQQIFREFLGRHWLHMVRRPFWLLAIKCAEEPVTNTYTRHHRCWGMGYSTRGLGPTPDFYAEPLADSTARAAGLLPLLLTCRLIYSEGIDILYHDNVFDFNHLDTILYLSRTVLPCRLRQIRSVCLQWEFKYGMYPLFFTPNTRDRDEQLPPYNAETWHEVCDVLAGLTGLQELYLSLDGFPTIPDKGLDQLLHPLHQIKGIESFDVILPSLYQLESLDLNDAPFRLLERGPRDQRQQ